MPKVSYTITADDATITVDGKAVTSAFAGEKVTVTAAGRENAEFTDWTDPNGVLKSDQLTAKEVNFTMPDEDVTLIRITMLYRIMALRWAARTLHQPALPAKTIKTF